MGRIKRTAIVFVHGQGEQRPMDSVRDLVRTAWATDPRFGARGTEADWLRYWSIPDERSDTYEMQRLSTEAAVPIQDKKDAANEGDGNAQPSGSSEMERFDFYEYYWAHLMSGTSLSHVWSWFQKLVKRDVCEVPNPLLRVRQVLVRILETNIAFAIVGIALSIHLIHWYLEVTYGVGGTVNPASDDTHWAAQGVFSFLTDHALLIALLASPLIGIFSICADQIRCRAIQPPDTEVGSNQKKWRFLNRAPTRRFNPGSFARNIILGLGVVMVPLIGLQSSSEDMVATGIMDLLGVALVLTIALLLARVLVGAAIVGTLATCLGLLTVIVLDFSRTEFEPKVSLDQVGSSDPNLVLLIMCASAAATAVFAIISRAGSYTIALVLAGLAFSAAFFLPLANSTLTTLPSEHPHVVAAMAAGWVVAYALLLPEAARFNRAGLEKGTAPGRVGHWAQYAVWALVPCALFILLNDKAFTTAPGAAAISPIIWLEQENKLVSTGYLPAAFIIAVLYSLYWIAVQLVWPSYSNRRHQNDPHRQRVVTHYAVLIVHLVMWFTWCVFLHTAVVEGGPWPVYWMFMATVFALPALIVLLVAANRAFLIPVLGDSARYLSPMPDNIEARQKIRETGVQLLESLHKNPAYDRIIVVAHSLGSVVALDVLKQLWARRVDKFQDKDLSPLLETVEDEALKLHAIANAPDTSKEMVRKARRDFRAAQSAYARELRKHEFDGEDGKEKSWRVSDFVTLGSPLTYAPFLLADTDRDYRRRLAKFELPGCPPDQQILTEEKYLKGQDGDGLFVYRKSSASEEHDHLVPRHGAMFSAMRWSNLYFATPGLVTGDMIAGELGSKFGHGIDSYVIANRPGNIRFAHNEYWKWSLSAGEEYMTGHEIRAALLAEDVPEHVIALRAALNLADSDDPDLIYETIHSLKNDGRY